MALSDDLKTIRLQEQELHFSRFDEDVAWQLGMRVRELAVARKFGVVIDVRRFGQALFYCALPGTSPDNPEWVRRKGNVVARFHRSSYAIGLELQQSGGTLMEKHGLSLADYAVHGGSFPIRVTNAGVIGSVTVSGIPQDYTSLALAAPSA